MKQSFGVLSKEYSEQLNDDELANEIPVLFLFKMLFAHKVHKLTDEFRHQEIQGCANDGDYNCHDDLPQIGEYKVVEQLVLLI